MTRAGGIHHRVGTIDAKADSATSKGQIRWECTEVQILVQGLAGRCLPHRCVYGEQSAGRRSYLAVLVAWSSN